MDYQDALPYRQKLDDEIRSATARLLAEDIGDGDITARLIPADAKARARVITRENCVLCGVAWVEALFARLDSSVALRWSAADGDRLEAGQAFLELEGSARSLLTGERAALNLLQTLSATATRTRHCVDLIAGTGVQLLDTRKTLPGLRLAQKYAVKCGGGHNHRIGLYDAFLIKENHIAACGGLAQAVDAARKLGPGKLVEVETETLDELDEALAAGADVIMLDNFSIEDTRTAVDRSRGKARIEASGGINNDTLT